MMFGLLKTFGFLCSLLVSGLIELRTDSGTLTIDFADAPVAMQVQTKEASRAELDFSLVPEGVKVVSGQYEILLPAEFKELRFKNNQLKIVGADGERIRVTYRRNRSDANPRPDQMAEPHPDAVEAESKSSSRPKSKSKTVQPPEKGYQLDEFAAAVIGLAELGPLAPYAESESVLLRLARSLPPQSLREQDQESLQLKAAGQLLLTLIEQSRTNRTDVANRVLVPSGDAHTVGDIVTANVNSAVLAVDLLRLLGVDSPQIRSLLQEEMQQVLHVLPQADGRHGWSGWKYHVAEDMESATGGKAGVLAALATADQRTATPELTYLNTVLRTWEDLTGQPMIFHNSPADTLHHMFGGSAIETGGDQQKYRYLPEVTTFDGQPFDHWISVATQGANSPAEFERQMLALKAGSVRTASKARCDKVRAEIVEQTFANFEPTEAWYERMRAILVPGVSETEAERLVNLVREQPVEIQEAILANVFARWRTIRAPRDGAPATAPGSDETTLSTDFQVLESCFEIVESSQTGRKAWPDEGPLANLIHENIYHFDKLPEGYQNALLTIFQSRQGLRRAQELLREIAITEGHPRRLEASLILARTGSTEDSFRDITPPALMQAVVDRAPQNQWLEAAGSFSILQGRKYSEATALRLVELIVADTKSGDIRPLQIRIPEPLTTNHLPMLPADYVAESCRDVVISRRIILTSILASPPPESQAVRERLALALAEAIPPEVFAQPAPFHQAEIPSELLFRLGDSRFRIVSATSIAGDSEIEKSLANQLFEHAMNRLLQVSDWRVRLKELRSSSQLESIPDPRLRDSE